MKLLIIIASLYPVVSLSQTFTPDMLYDKALIINSVQLDVFKTQNGKIGTAIFKGYKDTQIQFEKQDLSTLSPVVSASFKLAGYETIEGVSAKGMSIDYDYITWTTKYRYYFASDNRDISVMLEILTGYHDNKIENIIVITNRPSLKKSLAFNLKGYEVK